MVSWKDFHLHITHGVASDDNILTALDRVLENEMIVEFAVGHGHQLDPRCGFTDVPEMARQRMTRIAFKPRRKLIPEICVTNRSDTSFFQSPLCRAILSA